MNQELLLQVIIASYLWRHLYLQGEGAAEREEEEETGAVPGTEGLCMLW